MKNYYQSVERRFTIGKLEIRTLNFNDIAVLLIVSAAILFSFSFGMEYPRNKFYFLFFISFVLWFHTLDMGLLGMPIVLRFRSFYFSLCWLALCIIIPVIYRNGFAYLPLLLFLLFHILRLIFWKLYDREFIPFRLDRGIMIPKLSRYVSKIEGTGGFKEDKLFTRIFLIIGYLIFLICTYALVDVNLAEI